MDKNIIYSLASIVSSVINYKFLGVKKIKQLLGFKLR